jgi:cob(I)alamin adenosyltransferase
MKIYTRTGDDGGTALFGGGRVPKSDIRVEAYGSVDELNSLLGWLITQLPAGDAMAGLRGVQEDLFVIGAQLATPTETRGKRPSVPQLREGRTLELESWIDLLDADLEPLRTFILPGGSAAGAAIHVARTVCRRAERRVVALDRVDPVDPAIVRYLNRLSDLLFTLARHVNHERGVAEHPWVPPGPA